MDGGAPRGMTYSLKFTIALLRIILYYEVSMNSY